MELNAKVSTLEDEIKVLKGEVKSILKEIRTALLARDNPFAPDTSALIFKPVERPPKPEEFTADAVAGEAEEAPEPDPPPAAVADTPEPPPVQAPWSAPTPPPAQAPWPAPAPPPARVEAEPRMAPAQSPQTAAWSLMTIASLAAWAEDAAAVMGTQRLHILLDISEFAGLVPGELKEALLKLSKLGRSKDGEAGKGPSVNESLVVLRQLEAILHGQDPDEMSARRSARHYGRIR